MFYCRLPKSRYDKSFIALVFPNNVMCFSINIEICVSSATRPPKFIRFLDNEGVFIFYDYPKRSKVSLYVYYKYIIIICGNSLQHDSNLKINVYIIIFKSLWYSY